MDIDNPGNYYCVKCWEAYNADVAHQQRTHLVKENRFLSTQNAALAITVANVLADMDKMKERMEKMNKRADRHWKEISCLEQKIKDLQFLLNYQVESLNFDRIRELENEVDYYDACLGEWRQNKRELHAQIGELEAKIEWLQAFISSKRGQNEMELHTRIGELEAQIEGLQALTLTLAGNRDKYSSDDNKSLFSNSDDDGST